MQDRHLDDPVAGDGRADRHHLRLRASGIARGLPDAWDGILKAQFDYRHMPCNFVEIMPRLDEHLKRGKLRPA
jgi:hypothetical protein